jgi:hypothetical protein
MKKKKIRSIACRHRTIRLSSAPAEKTAMIVTPSCVFEVHKEGISCSTIGSRPPLTVFPNEE